MVLQTGKSLGTRPLSPNLSSSRIIEVDPQSSITWWVSDVLRPSESWREGQQELGEMEGTAGFSE